MKISTDEEYFELLERIVKGAEFLENPLIQEDQRKRGMERYEKYCEAAREYRSH